MAEKTEQEQEKAEKKPDGNTNKKSLSWTPERREKQKLAMIRLQASGRAYTGKKKIPDDKMDSTEPAISDIPPPAPSPEAESASSSDSYMGIATILLIFIAAVIAFFVFFRDEIMKIFKSEHE